MEIIVHIVSRQDAQSAKSAGVYRPRSLAHEGFIHCSYIQQVCQVANRLYKGNNDLVLIEINRLRIPHEVIDEDLYGNGQQYPHIYGELPWDAVIAVHQFPCTIDGTFKLPTTLIR